MEQMRVETSNKVVTAWLQAAAIISQKVIRDGSFARTILIANREIILKKSKIRIFSMFSREIILNIWLSIIAAYL